MFALHACARRSPHSALKMMCFCCGNSLQRRHGESGATADSVQSGCTGGTFGIDDDFLYERLIQRRRIGRARLQRALPFDLREPWQLRELSGRGLSTVSVHLRLRLCCLFRARLPPRLICLTCACTLVSRRLVTGVVIGDFCAYALEVKVNHSLRQIARYS